MRREYLLFVFVFLLAFTGSCIKSTNKNKSCICCEKTFTNIDSAKNCISRSPIINTTSDNRLFLLVFTQDNIEKNQMIGWDIFQDEEIIRTAKRSYLLVNLDPKNFQSQDGIDCSELNEIINNQKEDTFFVITNQALYPFAHWTLNEKKNVIINNLLIGNGP